MAADEFQETLNVLIYFAGGFLTALITVYSDLRYHRRRAAMLEKMNDHHNARIIECKTGVIRISSRFIIAEKRPPE